MDKAPTVSQKTRSRGTKAYAIRPRNLLILYPRRIARVDVRKVQLRARLDDQRTGNFTHNGTLPPSYIELKVVHRSVK